MEVMSWLQRERFFLFENELFINIFQYADMCFKHIYNLQIKKYCKGNNKDCSESFPFPSSLLPRGKFRGIFLFILLMISCVSKHHAYSALK